MNFQEFNNAANRFMNYVKIDTQADPESISIPSTEKQKDLSKLLYKELQDAKI